MFELQYSILIGDKITKDYILIPVLVEFLFRGITSHRQNSSLVNIFTEFNDKKFKFTSKSFKD